MFKTIAESSYYWIHHVIVVIREDVKNVLPLSQNIATFRSFANQTF